MLQAAKAYESKEWLSRYLGQIASNPIDGSHLIFIQKGRRKEGLRGANNALFINCTSKLQDELITRVEEMSGSRVGLKAELYYYDLSEEEDLSKLVTVFSQDLKFSLCKKHQLPT